MRHLKLLLAVGTICSALVLYSCTKTGEESKNTREDILIRHSWKHYQTRTITIDTITNTIIKDTLTQVELCYQNSLYVFAADSVIKRTLQCFTPPGTHEGRWFLNADSTFAGSILVRTSFGTGWVYTNFGLPYGKMKLLTETDFHLKAYDGFTYGSVRAYNIYYLKATN